MAWFTGLEKQIALFYPFAWGAIFYNQFDEDEYCPLSKSFILISTINLDFKHVFFIFFCLLQGDCSFSNKK